MSMQPIIHYTELTWLLSRRCWQIKSGGNPRLLCRPRRRCLSLTYPRSDAHPAQLIREVHQNPETTNKPERENTFPAPVSFDLFSSPSLQIDILKLES